MLDIPLEQFEDLVRDALDTIPDELARLISNCVVLVADDSPPGWGTLLGLYEGIPLTQRSIDYGAVLPDRITIYRRPILSICSSRSEVIDQVRITVVHEVAHHFGIDDDRLHELGWG